MTAINNIETRVESVTISNGGTTSTAIDTSGLSILGIVIPSSFTGTAISFQTSIDNSTYNNLYNTSNTLVSMNVTQARSYGIVPSDFAGWRFLKLVSNATEGGSREIKLLLRTLA